VNLGKRGKKKEKRGKMLGAFCVVLDRFFVPLLCTKNTRTDGWFLIEVFQVVLDRFFVPLLCTKNT